MAEWIRAPLKAGAERRLIVRWDPTAPENKPLEEFLQRIPYGQGNTRWVELLRAALTNPAQPTAPPNLSVPAAPALALAGQRPHLAALAR